MTDCSINENQATQGGGGMYISGDVNLMRCKIHNNVTLGDQTYPSGAGLCLGGRSSIRAIIVDSDIYQNIARKNVEHALETKPKYSPITKYGTHETRPLCLAGWRTRLVGFMELWHLLLPGDS